MILVQIRWKLPKLKCTSMHIQHRGGGGGDRMYTKE